MDAAEIASLCESLSLSENDGPITQLGSDLRRLGQIGAVCEVDLGTTGDCAGKFLRLRIRIDVSKPLRRCIRVDLDGSGKAVTMLLRYERLPEFCFQCGHVGHATRECIQVESNLIAAT
ncbi:hypothetical protein JRO89_XS07G0149900 [Xanthoceras sorbifolium]|uniref:CCHC-type domain-containing protein n=1 Tax=Xanthoceras sorbifolium TaxID=99658 RepID=A0ABQ8HTU7_9ROSI|nr:hypothetical protein JRO89_XS07G0149900 [Xanthoceras sorbifolium]